MSSRHCSASEPSLSSGMAWFDERKRIDSHEATVPARACLWLLVAVERGRRDGRVSRIETVDGGYARLAGAYAARLLVGHRSGRAGTEHDDDYFRRAAGGRSSG